MACPMCLGIETMTRSLSLLVLLVGCGLSDSSNGAPPEAIAPASTAALDAPTADALSRLDVRGTAESMGMIAETVRALSPERKAQAGESLRILSVNDPYTRSALQLPFALHKVVMGIDSASLDPLIQSDWEYLTAGLTSHVAVLDALGVDLSEPVLGDSLFGRYPAVMVSRDTLLAGDDPIGATASLLGEVPALAERIDAPTMHIIDTKAILWRP